MNSENTSLEFSDTGNAQKKDRLPLIVLTVAGLLSCICLVAAFVFGIPYFRSKSVIVLEPDRSQVSNVSRSDLEEAARILTERCKELKGCSSISFIVSENDQIIGEAPPFMSPKMDETMVKRLTTIGLLEFVDFGNTPINAGTTVVTDLEHPFFPTQEGETWHTVMTNADIASTVVEQDSLGRYGIFFTLSEQGTQIFYEHTSTHIGTYLGIVLDKVVISSPIINAAIEAGQGQIQGSFTLETAQDMAIYLKITPLPIPLVVVEETEQ